MSDSACRICGGPAAAGQRYCDGCDFQARKDHGADGAVPAARSSRPRGDRNRGALSVFLLVFMIAAGGTVGIGMTVTDGFSLPAIRQTLGLDEPRADEGPEPWGEVRFVHTATRIRSGRSTKSEIVGQLQPGDSVRADFAERNWYAVFPLHARERSLASAIGFVYGPLLKTAPPAGA